MDALARTREEREEEICVRIEKGAKEEEKRKEEQERLSTAQKKKQNKKKYRCNSQQ